MTAPDLLDPATSDSAVDAELRRLGVDPVAVGERGEAFAKMAAENARLREEVERRDAPKDSKIGDFGLAFVEAFADEAPAVVSDAIRALVHEVRGLRAIKCEGCGLFADVASLRLLRDAALVDAQRTHQAMEALQMIVRGFYDFEAQAENFVTSSVIIAKERTFELTLRRVDGKTPHDVLGELRAELEPLRDVAAAAKALDQVAWATDELPEDLLPYLDGVRTALAKVRP